MAIGWKDFSCGLVLGVAGMALVNAGFQSRSAATKELETPVVVSVDAPATGTSSVCAPAGDQAAQCPERETVVIRYVEHAADPARSGANEADDALVVPADRVDAFPDDADLFDDDIAETDVMGESEVDEERRWVEREHPVDIYQVPKMPSGAALAEQRLAHEQAIEDEAFDAEQLDEWAATIDHTEYPEHLPPEVW